MLITKVEISVGYSIAMGSSYVDKFVLIVVLTALQYCAARTTFLSSDDVRQYYLYA
jgi:hypothetical protein